MKKLLSSIMVLAIVLSCTNTINVSATNNQMVTENEIINWLPSYINLDDPDIQQEIQFIKENAVDLSSKKVYYEIVSDKKTGETLEKNLRTEEDYKNFKQKDSMILYSFKPDKSYTRSNSWIELEFKSVTLSSGKYRLYVYYDWKTKPFFTLNDVLALGHDSNMSFNTSSFYSKHYQYIYSNRTQNDSYTYDDTDNVYSTTSGVSVKFDLPSSPDTSPTDYNGYLRVDAEFTNPNITSGNLHCLYGHSQLSISFDLRDAISFATSGVPSFSITGAQDEFTFGDQFLK